MKSVSVAVGKLDPSVVAEYRGAAEKKMGLNERVAAQLTAEYKKAVGGLVAVVRFGAKLGEVRDNIARAAIDSGAGGDATLKKFLTEHCPEISIPTAYRFMETADATRALCEVSPDTSLVKLLCASAAKLTGDLKKKRAQIEKALADFGSQRQLLLAFHGDEGDEPAAPAKTGGDVMLQSWLKKHHPDHAGKKLAQLPKDVRAEWNAHLDKLAAEKNPDGDSRRRMTAREFWDDVRQMLRNDLATTRHYTRLPDAELKAAQTVLKDTLAAINDELAKT